VASHKPTSDHPLRAMLRASRPGRGLAEALPLAPAASRESTLMLTHRTAACTVHEHAHEHIGTGQCMHSPPCTRLLHTPPTATVSTRARDNPGRVRSTVHPGHCAGVAIAASTRPRELAQHSMRPHIRMRPHITTDRASPLADIWPRLTSRYPRDAEIWPRLPSRCLQDAVTRPRGTGRQRSAAVGSGHFIKPR